MLRATRRVQIKVQVVLSVVVIKQGCAKWKTMWMWVGKKLRRNVRWR